MKKLPLHLKYRPVTFDQVLGNSSLIESLKVVLNKESRPSTYLLQGPSGTGKTTIARIIAKEIGAKDLDIRELNIADTRGIDAARTIIENARFMPLGGSKKIYILDEVANATNNFFEALLKILEEPPRKTYFILCTTDPQKLPITIRNRCAAYQVQSLRRSELMGLIKKVLIEEGRRKFPKEAIEKIAKSVDGCPRQALVLLDLVINMENEKILDAINKFSFEKESIIDLCRALLQKNSWKAVAKLIKGLDEEPESIRYAVLGYMGNVLLNKKSDQAFLIINEFSTSFIYSKKAGLISACYTICSL